MFGHVLAKNRWLGWDEPAGQTRKASLDASELPYVFILHSPSSHRVLYFFLNFQRIFLALDRFTGVGEIRKGC